MKIQDKELNQLRKEIDHILDSGANSIRLLNMFEAFVDRHGEKFISSKPVLADSMPLSEWLQTTMKGRHLMMQITFPIANQFKTHPEKIPIELVVEIVEAVRGNFR